MLIYHLQYPTLCSVPQRMILICILIFILIIFYMLNLIFTLIIFNMLITIGANGSHKEQDSQGFAEPGEGRTLSCWSCYKNTLRFLYDKNALRFLCGKIAFRFLSLNIFMKLGIYDCD